ncbi:MAG: hypothetical protein ACREQL_13245 [Candidatus Binatia bacterium]
MTTDDRLAALEARLRHLETLLGALNDKLERGAGSLGDARTGIQQWVTDYVSMRLQQLVPETCEHPEGEQPQSVGGIADDVTGPVLPGTRIRCTDEVLHRLGRIPIPFVRQMVTQKVAETARAEKIAVVDVPFFERSATF